MQEPRTPEQLRHAIDSGGTHDKIDMNGRVQVGDPAAAPLHTDQEASDAPTPPESIARDWREQRKAAATIPADSGARPWAWGLGGLAAMIVVALVAFALT